MSTAGVGAVALRVVPFQVRRPQRLFERHVMAYSRQWMIIFSGFFEPLFYLLSIRVGLDNLVGAVSYAGTEVPYDMFVAPALMASSAMNGAVFDSTGNVFGRLKHMRIYDAVLATPMTPGDVAVGEIGWALFRGQIYAISFLLVMWAMGLTASWWALLMVPACALIGLCFAGLGFVFTTFMRSWSDLEIVTTITMPMFLFSATFFPVSAYGGWAWLVQFSPLYHGVALLRGLNFGELSWTMLWNAGVLVAISLVALHVASRRVDALLRR